MLYHTRDTSRDAEGPGFPLPQSREEVNALNLSWKTVVLVRQLVCRIDKPWALKVVSCKKTVSENRYSHITMPDATNPRTEDNQAARSGSVRVFVYSHHNVLLRALQLLVTSLDYQVAELDQADLVLMDLTAKSDHYPLAPATPTLALINGDEADAIAVLQLGYQGYVQHDSKPELLAYALQAVHKGENWAERKVVAKALADNVRPQVDLKSFERAGLTPREQEILSLLLEGLTNREIGEQLGIAEKTVKGHASSVYSKLGIKDRKDLLLLLG